MEWGRGARGRLEGCTIEWAREAGLHLRSTSTSPAVRGNTFCMFRRRFVIIGADVDAAWDLGEGNVFTRVPRSPLYEEDAVEDQRPKA